MELFSCLSKIHPSLVFLVLCEHVNVWYLFSFHVSNSFILIFVCTVLSIVLMYCFHRPLRWRSHPSFIWKKKKKISSFFFPLHRSRYVHLFSSCSLFYNVYVFVYRPLRCLLMESRLRMMLTGFINEPRTWSSSSGTHCSELKVAEMRSISPLLASSISCQLGFQDLSVYCLTSFICH